MSLFSGLGQSKPPGSSSLFGQPATSSAQTGAGSGGLGGGGVGGGGLFGSAPAAAASSQQQQQQQPSGGLFSGLGQAKQQTQQAAVSGD